MNSLLRAVGFAFAGLILFAEVHAQEAAAPAAQAEPSPPASLADLPVSMESQPYRVRLLIASDAEPFDEVRHDVNVALERSVGNLWRAEIGELKGLVRIDAEALRRWTLSDVQSRFNDDDVQFWFAVTVHRRGSQLRLAVRAWQPRFEWLSPVHEASFYEPRETAARIVKLCWGLFRPEILIENVDGNDARVRIPAGDLKAADPAFTLFQPGDCLTPWLMYYDRDKKLKRRQELPWTYVRLDKIKGPLATGSVLSGLRMPLAGKTRGRIDKVAVASRPVYPDTRLQIAVQNQPTRILAGNLLELRPKLPEPRTESDKTEGDKPPEDDVAKLLTDRMGEVTLEPKPDQAMTWIYVYSGDLLLARVPFVPGSLAKMRLDVPDDSIRLQVVGELQMLEGQLINVVAERNTLVAAARTAAKKKDWKRVTQLKNDFDKLPLKDSFVDRLSAIRVPALNAAKAKKDRSSQVRVDRLCNDAADLIDRYLDPEKLQTVQEELEELQKLEQEVPKE